MDITTHIEVEHGDEDVEVLITGTAEYETPYDATMEEPGGGGWYIEVTGATYQGRPWALTPQQEEWAEEAIEAEACEQYQSERESGLDL